MQGEWSPIHIIWWMECRCLFYFCLTWFQLAFLNKNLSFLHILMVLLKGSTCTLHFTVESHTKMKHVEYWQAKAFWLLSRHFGGVFCSVNKTHHFQLVCKAKVYEMVIYSSIESCYNTLWTYSNLPVEYITQFLICIVGNNIWRFLIFSRKLTHLLP